MALKALLETLDDVAEAFHSEYKQVKVKGPDGQEKEMFALDIIEPSTHPDVLALKTAFDRVKNDKQRLNTELTEARKRLEKIPEDFDPDEYQRLLDEEAERQKDPNYKRTDDEKLQAARNMYEQRIKTLETKAANDLKSKDEILAKKDKFINALLVDDGLTQALVAAGVDKAYLKAAKAMLRDSVKVKNEGDKYEAVVETDLGEQDIPKFVMKWVQSDEGKAFVTKPSGSGANGNDSRNLGDNPWDTKGGKVKPNLTKQQELIRTNPEKARQLAQAAGVTPAW